ncbi:cytochrome P450 2B15-like [Garra rufa]|uniref:cytochrome P450 2B15-like n=1 Tax=Garra rufa TaxID=137080 RepID=UPI003CCE9AE1
MHSHSVFEHVSSSAANHYLGTVVNLEKFPLGKERKWEQVHQLAAVLVLVLNEHSSVIMWTTLVKLDLTSVCLALFLGLILMLLFEIFRINSYSGQTPPGPRPLPFVGVLPQLAKNPMEFIRSVSQYGEISTMYIGRQPTIVLNTIQVTKEALVQEAFSGRPAMPLIEWITNGLGIIMVTFGHSWRQQRRFALHTLRNFGLGKKSVEDRVLEESRYLIAEMLKAEGKSMNPQHPIQNAVSNIICSIVFGDRFDYDNKRFSYLLKILNENFMLAGSPVGQIFNLAPFIKHFPGPHQKVMQNATELLGFIRDEVKEHKETLDPDSPRDFIDAYLLEIEKQKSNKDSTFHEENMMMSTADLFLAGTDTTATTIRWGLIFLIQNPDVQERCHEEIVRVLGYDRLPSMDDRDKLPYTYATVHEIQRCANIVPLGVIHETIRPTKLCGYDIPQGTMIMSNLNAIFSDKKHWKHPNAFNPENFLDENGNFCKPESFIVFSLGPRVCLGETLARTELFLYITSLLQRIQFSWPPEPQSIDMDGIMGVVRYPQTYNLVCRSRDTKD